MIDLFTKHEKIFIIFLVFGIIVGSGIELYRTHIKTNNNTIRIKDLENLEKQIQKKVVLIDSILEGTNISAEQDKIFNNKKSKLNNRGRSSQKKLLVDINSATVEELVQLPQVGPVIANRIVEYRNANGEFKNIEDLIKVRGIGKKKLNSITPYIYIKYH